MSTALERNRRLFAGPFGAGYSAYIERERIALVVGRIVWGSDIRPYYASMRAISEAPEGSTVVDCPCGAGVALRALRPEQQVRYLAFDLSPAMLRRARARARRRDLSQPIFREAEATNLPLADGEADLFVSYFGLHCFDDPAGAIREAARALAPGGRLVGATITRGDRMLDKLRVSPRRGGFGDVGDRTALRGWLEAAGFGPVELETNGIFAFFRAYLAS